MGESVSRIASGALPVCTRCSLMVRSSVKEAKDTGSMQRRPDELSASSRLRGAEQPTSSEKFISHGSERSEKILSPSNRTMQAKSKNNSYQMLSSTMLEVDAPEEDEFSTMVAKGRCSQEMMDWAEKWLSAAEYGELDIYTCWGLSNANTCSKSSRRLYPKVIGVTCLQLIIPSILLSSQLADGFSLHVRHESAFFRVMGLSLYLYSLYSMYNNALDECRSQLLQFSIDQRVVVGHWWPLLAGEFLNVFVSLILVVTLFFIFSDTQNPCDLILNAVAVNFLGSVDGEFVDRVSKEEALKAFKGLFERYGNNLLEPQERQSHNRTIKLSLNIALTLIVLAGLVFAVMFSVAPVVKYLPKNATKAAKGYPKLV